jgi:hypothetical protein
MSNAPYDWAKEGGVSTPVQVENLQHALMGICTDPDCEIHNPEVGIAEQTVTPTDLAFFVAGYDAGAAAMGDQYDSVKGNLRDELQQAFRPQEGV